MSFCYCNPTTFLSEAALGYLALDILQRNNIEVININDEEYAIKKYKNQLDFINKVWESNSVYKLDFKDNYNEWQSTFDKLEQDNVNNYLNGHDRVYYGANRNRYVIIAPSEELNWKTGKGNNQKLSVNLNTIFGVDRIKNVGHADLLRLFSSIINDDGESSKKKTMNDLLDNISNRRTKKMISSGQFAAAITEDKGNEIAKNNKFNIIQAAVGNGKYDRFCINLNGNDLEKMDLESAFYKYADIGDNPLDENKIENSKKYFKVGANDNMINEVKEALVKNINSKAKKAAREHASLVKFTENKDFMKLDYGTSSDSKIKSISCKV